MKYFHVLLLFLLGTCSLTIATLPAFAQTAPDKAKDPFVRVDPKNFRYFMQKGKRFEFQGTNQRELPIGLAERSIEETFRTHKEKGLRVVRVWAFNEDSCGITGCFMVKQNDGSLKINDQALERLDQTLFYAAKYGIKLVMVPLNYEPSFGGMENWVKNVKGSGHPHIDFYRDGNVQTAYRTYLRTLTSRVNTKNGVRYSDDPTIMAWDVANEPHTKDGYDPTGQIVARFICDTARFMREELRLKQMITSGEEGYMTNGDLGGIYKGHEWINNGLKGVDFETNAKCSYLDYMTVHLYPDNWEIERSKFAAFIDRFLLDRAGIAHQNKKPLVVEEFGCCLAQDYKGQRAQIFREYLAAFTRHQVAGQLVWQLFPSNSQLVRDVNNYDFTFESDKESAALLTDRAAMHNENSRNTVGASVTGSNSTVPVQ